MFIHYMYWPVFCRAPFLSPFFILFYFIFLAGKKVLIDECIIYENRSVVLCDVGG
ncbi:hypothetical protein BDV35DRAFT_363723 [Aspergillus flavus]|uniref:Uncharacterized protein n=1 Tax=Aspergillus flavus TaxID=5059 RepID=A0A5N6GPY1_ASPFL|nr:hypothetical protein BDV35DRAFT_363723 [Aspergillus flavus]